MQTIPTYKALAGANTFLPTQISGCLCWVRSDLGITTVSGSVSAWADQSGNNKNVSQGKAGKRPVYNTSGGVNNFPYLQNAAQGFLSFGSTSAFNTLTGTNGCEAFGVQKINSYGNNGVIWSMGGSGATLCHEDVPANTNNSDVYSSFFSSNFQNSATPVYLVGSYSKDNLFVYNCASKTNYFHNKLNGGVYKFSTTTNTFSNTRTTYSFALMGDPAGVWWTDGPFYEFVLYNRVLNSTERNAMHNYLYKRYSIANGLYDLT